MASACFDQLTVLGQYYASSLTSHGLLDLCSTFGLGPTWPASVIASVSAIGTSAAAATDTNIETITIFTGSATENATQSPTHSPTQSATQSATQSPTQTVTTGSGSFSLAQPSLLVWLLLWLLAL